MEAGKGEKGTGKLTVKRPRLMVPTNFETVTVRDMLTALEVVVTSAVDTKVMLLAS